jgi:hypothetical protein
VIWAGAVGAFLGAGYCLIMGISTFSAFGVAAGAVILCVSYFPAF